MKKLSRLKLVLLCIALTFMAGAFIAYPQRYIVSCFQGFIMWAECVLPSLFPFMVITLILIKTGVAERAALPLKKVTGLFGLPPAAAVCFLMSACSGYPAGARAVAEFYENGCISSADCKKLCALCSTSGPLFIIGSVGVKMLNSAADGWKILAAHITSVLVIAIIFALAFKRKSPHTEYRRAVPNKNVLYDSFYSAVISVAVAGGFISFFCVAAQIAADFNLLLPLEKLLCLFTEEETSSAVCRGLMEATAGCKALSQTESSLTLPFCGFLITFGGASILLQQLSYFTQTKVSAAYFIGIKFLQGLLCFFILLICA